MNLRKRLNLFAISFLVVIFLAPFGANGDGEKFVKAPMTPQQCGNVFAVDCERICEEAGAIGAAGFLAAKPYKDIHCVCIPAPRTPDQPFGPGPVFEF
jgi:hypothetical protein